MSPASHGDAPHRGRWVAATVLLLVGAALSLLPAFMAIFLFDDPKAGWDPIRSAIAYALMTLPLACFLGASLPWQYRSRPNAWGWFLLPLVNGAFLAPWLLPSVHLFE